MFSIAKTIQLSSSSAARAFHTTRPLFLFGSGAIKVEAKEAYVYTTHFHSV